jgi:hypothetical protein
MISVSGSATPNGHSRRSLFAFYPDEDEVTLDPPGRPRDSSGGHTVKVQCSRCETATSLSPSSLLRHMIPSCWVPGLAMRWWMHCPACGARTVCHLDVSGLR